MATTMSRHELPSREQYENEVRVQLTGKWSYDEVEAAFNEYTEAEQAFDAALEAVDTLLHQYLYYQRADGSESLNWPAVTEKILPSALRGAYDAYNYVNAHYPDELTIGRVGWPAYQRYPITNWKKSAGTFRRLAAKLNKALKAAKA